MSEEGNTCSRELAWHDTLLAPGQKYHVYVRTFDPNIEFYFTAIFHRYPLAFGPKNQPDTTYMEFDNGNISLEVDETCNVKIDEV